MSIPLRAGLAVPCLLLGAALAVCTIALHGYWWGLGLGVAATLAVLIALPTGWWSRLPCALGWVGVLAAAMPQRPEGDYLIAGDVRGYLLLGFGGAVLIAGVLDQVPRRRFADDAARVGMPT